MIRTGTELAEVCTTLRQGGVAALDTEFVWRNTYRPMLALVQLGAADGTSWVEDCLKGFSAQPLAELLEDPGTVKVLHDAHQDLEHLHHYSGGTPVNVFDTQLAAAFAGLPAGMSLQRLVAEITDVTLPKTETVTDWTQRPLTEAQLAYALDDVRYLGRVREALIERADQLGTRAWMEADMLRYEKPEQYGDVDPYELWKRVKCGRVRLDGRGFALLRSLVATREKWAREWNLPRPWLADDASLVELAADGVKPAAQLRFRHRLRNGGQRVLIAARFAEALEEGMQVPEDDLPLNPHPHYLPEVQKAADEALKLLRERAEEVHVDAVVIANRATVTAWVDNPDDDENPLASGWRHEVVGREIAERFQV